MNLGHVRKTRGYALSGGERRRVEIARCLAIEPAFILLDEPFSGIDPIAVLDLQEIIFGLKRSGIGVLITDHNVRETLVGDGPGVHHHMKARFLRRERRESWGAIRRCAGSIWERSFRWIEGISSTTSVVRLTLLSVEFAQPLAGLDLQPE